MKKRLLCLVVIGLLVLAFGAVAGATPPMLADLPGPVAGSSPVLVSPAWAARGDVVNPTVSAVAPASAYNDIDTAVTITGAGFATDLTGTMLPTATLGTTPLTNVTLVDATTLTAMVP